MAKKEQRQATKPLKRATQSEKIVRMLSKPAGTTIAELQRTTGWQAHSIRGFISGTVKKRMGLEISSERAKEGKQRYKIIERVDA